MSADDVKGEISTTWMFGLPFMALYKS